MANINKQERQQLYEWFETGDRPSQLQFQDFIDSMIIQDDDEVWVENDDPSYLNYLGIGTTSPVGRVSISGETVIGAGFSSDRSIPSTHLPDDGLVVEGDVKIGTHNNRDYRLEIKSRTSTNANTGHQRPLLINSANHTMIVFNDEDGTSTNPFTVIDEKGLGVKFWKFAPNSATGSHTLVYMAPDGKMGVHNDNPIAKVDINAFGDVGMRINTHSNDAILFSDTNSTSNPNPFTFVENADRGFRFYTNTPANGGEHLRITPDGKVGINESNPQERLEVRGNVVIHPGGNLYGKRTGMPLQILSNSDATDGSYIEMGPLNPSSTSTNDKGQITFVSVGTHASSGFNFLQHRLNGVWKKPLEIDADSNLMVQGKMGINAGGTPTNTLDIASTGNDTGLRLRNGSAVDKILGSDANGNASWMYLSAFTASGAVPIGAIIMWNNGSQKPAGWVFCDGNNGSPIARTDGNGTISVPDLRSRFIVGHDAGQTSNPAFTSGHDLNYGTVGNRGGKDFVTLDEQEIPDHAHSLTSPNAFVVDGGGHSHGLSQLKYRDGIGGYLTLAKTTDNKGNSPSIGERTDFEDDHGHDIGGRTDNYGAGDQHENRPTYIVMAFIMKH